MSEVMVAADSQLFKTQDGKYWCKTIYGYSFWERYLNVFESIAVVSRTRTATFEEVDGYLRVDGPNVRVQELPFMRGMQSYLKNYLKFKNAAKVAVDSANCAIIRLPSVSASMVLKYVVKKNIPFAIEVVADPFDAYASNKIAQHFYTKELKKSVLNANGVSYVTEYYLQQKYPSKSRVHGPNSNYFESFYSTIDLKPEFFSTPKKFEAMKSNLHVVHTANSINNNMKGHDTLIKIAKNLADSNIDINVTFIGDGSARSYFEKMAMELGIGDRINFTGLIPSNKVREYLLAADIFVFPSRAEGLPRAVIEAMAIGLPCLSTPVNGIPELLEDEFLFQPDDVLGFSEKILALIEHPDELEGMSERNILKAKEYLFDRLSIKRTNFYRMLKVIAEE
ncbi:glycosyltransferase family 4 protein [Rossellomorea marisflavi]|uniref:glycosyltransferase family 4 protein n=1 Tax=Rossellomorea marisflavi TaxID=189381 RepID=UPI003D2EB897